MTERNHEKDIALKIIIVINIRSLHIECRGVLQTCNLSKILYRWIFRPKILHCQFHLISAVLVIETQKMSENEEIYTAVKDFTLPPTVTGVTNIISDYIVLYCKTCNSGHSQNEI